MADTKLTALSELSVPAIEDLFYTVDDPAGTPVSNKLTATRLLGQLSNVPGGRLTLQTGRPVDYLEQTLTPSGTSTVNDTIDFAAAPGWLSGTPVTVSATAGGLTVKTIYYLNAADTDTFSFHTTATAALAGTGKVDLTATITATVTSLGMAGSTLYYTPWHHNRVRVYDGTRWLFKTFSEISLALTLTSGSVYDVFLDDDASTLVLSSAWASATARTDALGTQDTVQVLSSDHTKLYLGTIWANETNILEDSYTRRRIDNYYNPIQRRLFRDLNGTGAYDSTTIRQFDASTLSQVEFVSGMRNKSGFFSVTSALSSATSGYPRIGIGQDSTTTFVAGSFFDFNILNGVIRGAGQSSLLARLGTNTISLNQVSGSGTGTSTFDSCRIFGVIPS